MSERELQVLRDRVAMLEEILGIKVSTVIRLRAAFALQPKEATVLGMLLSRQLVTKDAMYAVLYGHLPECDQPVWKSIDVLLHKLRKKLRARDIEFVSMVMQGYVMRPHDKQRVRDLLDQYEVETVPPAQEAIKPKSAPVIAFTRKRPSVAA